MESKTSVTNLKLNHLKIKANVYKGIVLVVKQTHLATHWGKHSTLLFMTLLLSARPFSELKNQLTHGSKVAWFCPEQWQASDGQRMLVDKQEKQEQRVEDQEP